MRIRVRDMALCALFTALFSIGALIRIPFFTSSVTLQFLFTNLSLLVLGRNRALISSLLYTAIGLCGAPVFTMGGGFSYIFQPSFGYILGFSLGILLGGTLLKKTGRSLKGKILATSLNLLIVYSLGIAYTALICAFYLGTPRPLYELLIYGGAVFLPVDIISSVFCVAVSDRLRKVTERI